MRLWPPGARERPRCVRQRTLEQIRLHSSVPYPLDARHPHPGRHPPLGPEPLFFVTWLFLALTVQHDSRLSAVVGLAFLATYPFLLIADQLSRICQRGTPML